MSGALACFTNFEFGYWCDYGGGNKIGDKGVSILAASLDAPVMNTLLISKFDGG